MKITSTGAGARGAYYDRNPLNASVSYSSAGLAPAGTTTRFTYTVPAGRKALLTGGHIRWRRPTAAAPVGLVTFNIQDALVNLGLVRTANNVVEAVEGYALALGQYEVAGTTILGQTTDTSTGGSCDYDASLSITEFDA